MKVITIKASRAAGEVKRFQEAVSFSVETSAAVRPVLEEIQAKGDDAVLAFTKRFDGVELDRRKLKVTPREMASGWARISASEKRAIRHSIRAIREYHRNCLPKGWSDRNAEGMTVGERFYPLRRVGLYVPGGRVPLVSTVLMTVVPGQVAGVGEIALCTPPQKDGTVADGLLAAFHALGLKEVYRIGGAQAIGAMAYGTRTVPSVDMVAGPGNAFVMEAKRQVFGQVGVDLLPGPSEVMVIADDGADPAWVAADLLSQAEHGTGKEKIYLAVPSRDLWKKIQVALQEQIAETEGTETMEKILQDRFLIGVYSSDEDVVAFANAVAPEHLELQVAPARIAKLSREITTAGAILQGYHTPTVLGDFVAGPSHTLPTDGTGRFSGGLQSIDFMRRSSFVRSTPKANRAVLPTVEAFAAMESLPVHAASLRCRVESKA
ncbi:MAG: histidinol dehydrogenase [Puniceicoccales bacterium]